MSRIVLRGGTVADGSGGRPRVADVAIVGERITRVGEVPPKPGDETIDVSGRVVMPGFIDAHSHAEGRVFDPEVQLSLLRQGVTSIIGGQDGVSYAPGDGAYATDYFGALNGAHPSYRGSTVAELLATYDATTPINVGYVIPAGTVRFEAVGYRGGPASPTERLAMAGMVREGMREGALGISTGLDYVPGIHQDTDEIVALVAEAAEFGGLYVTHMRGGYEENSRSGLDEVARIALATGVRAHVSHLHGPADVVLSALDDIEAAGVDVSFDAYPYRRGCTLAAMPLLPPDLLSGARAEVVAQLQHPAVRARLVDDWFPVLDERGILGPEWPDNFTFAHIDAAEWEWAEGLTVRVASARAQRTPAELMIDVLTAARLQVSCVVAVRQARSYDDMARILTDRRHTAGSDGIWVGRYAHPRARGTFARFLSLFLRERADYDLAEAAVHLSSRAAERFGMRDRGLVRPGAFADLAVVDTVRVGAGASYADPVHPATGIDDVIVAGRVVLRDGALTGALAGRGIRRGTMT